jgi:hypothetical protein
MAAIIGITFFIMAIIIHLQLAIGLSIGVLTVNQNLETPYFLLGLVSVLFSIGGFWLSRVEIGKVPKIQRNVDKKCYNCDKELLLSTEQVELIKNISNGEQKVNLCKDCIVKELDKQDGVCPQCKKPLKWNGNLRDFFGEWYHPKCVYEIQQGKHTKEVKEVTQEVIVKVRCQYCKYSYNESLGKCPQCGAKN